MATLPAPASSGKSPDLVPFRELPDGMATTLFPPRFYALATAVILVRQNNQGDTRLVYVDGTEETGRLDYDIALEENFFKVVGDAQEAAREGQQ